MKYPTRYLIPVLALFLLVACKEEAPPPVEEVTRPAKIFTVEAPGAAYIRSFPGEVKATDVAELAFRVSGELIEFPATRGLRVKQGDLLARLDPSDYQVTLEQATAEYQLAKSQFKRLQGLVEKQLISEADFDTRQAELRVAQSTWDKAKNNLDYTQIYAPFDGRVARLEAENFETVASGQVVLVLHTGEMVDIIVDVPESIVARVERLPENRNLEPIKVRFDTVSAKMYEALYKEHETQADSATLTYKVTFSMPAPEDINILPGMTATVVVDLSGILNDQTEGYLLPIESVFAAEDAAINTEIRYVWKVDADSMRARQAEVRVGSLTGDSIVVLDGVSDGDMVIAAGVTAVHENMPVRPLTREAGL
jgi:RND family efflux transporter MFP subunit